MEILEGVMSFSSKVKEIKKERKMTSEALAKLSGVPLGTLTKILSGATDEPKLSVAYKIALALDCPLDALVSDSDYLSHLTEKEQELVKNYRMLDERGKGLVELLIDKEIERVSDENDKSIIFGEEKRRSAEMITLPLFMLPVSAGTGAILDNSDSENIQVRSSYTARLADFALKVSGNSMEPTFHNGDVLLVQKQNYVEKGELGIFVGDGEGYFKRFMGKYLHSLNPEYEDIPLSRFTDFICCGKVIGNLKKKSS